MSHGKSDEDHCLAIEVFESQMGIEVIVVASMEFRHVMLPNFTSPHRNISKLREKDKTSVKKNKFGHNSFLP